MRPETARAVVVSKYGAAVLDAFAEGLRADYAGEIEIEISPDAPAGAGIVGVAVAPPNVLTAEHLTALPDLKVLVAASSGYDHLAVDAARASGISVANTPGYSDIEVADHTIASATMLLRAIPFAEHALRSGVWNARATGARRIAGARLGIAGLGRIGRLVLARAVALGMTAVVWAPRTPSEQIRDLGGEPVDSLHEMLADCDVVTLHVPLSDDTYGLLGAAEFARMRPSSYVVNTGRGELIDIGALRDALESGHLAGAALDVFDVEPLPADHAALALPNTVVTPHMAWVSPESSYESYRMAGRAIAAVLNGGAPQHPLGWSGQTQRA